MKLFKNDIEAFFVKRPNRFIIIARIEGEEVTCHCPNTGRMAELMLPDAILILELSNNPLRKTAYTVVAVYKDNIIVPIASVRANNVASEIVIPYLFDNPIVKKEYTYGKSRFDFLIEENEVRTFIEVKACTLFEGDMAIFPDAPTSRGLKHIKELEESIKEGYQGVVLFIIFNQYSKIFTPNTATDPEFSKALESFKDSLKIIPFKVGIDKNGAVSFLGDESILPIIWKNK